MNAEQLWNEFCDKKGIDRNTPYEAWAFCGGGSAADKLANLVLQGKKFGTASMYEDFFGEDASEEMPKVGDYSVILDSREEAVCILKDYEVLVKAFGDVPPFHAYAEGEGDRSLKYWRDIHKEFFEQEIEGTEMQLTEESKIVCEKFTLEYVPGRELDEDELIFAEPSMEYADEIAAYRQEMLDAKSSFDGCFSLKRMSDPQAFISDCMNWANPRRKADEQGAWGNVILVLRKSDRKMVGCMQVHNVLTQRMKDYTGHVGYSVRPSERGKGYAKRMLAKAIDFLGTFGFEEIFVSCIPENEASKTVILANGGEFIEKVFMDCDQVYLNRYRIRL